MKKETPEKHYIYLAKSQQADDNLVRMVHSYLRSLKEKFDVEILEHTGSSDSYDSRVVQNADSVIIIPPIDSQNDTESVWIGKGIYSTLADYFNEPPANICIDDLERSRRPLVVFSDNKQDPMRFYEIDDITYKGSDWKIRYALLSLKDDGFFVKLDLVLNLPLKGIKATNSGGGIAIPEPDHETVILVRHPKHKRL